MRWFNYLDKRHVPFAIRIRKDSLCNHRCPAYAPFAPLPRGELKIVNNAYNLHGCRLRLVGMKLAHDAYAVIATNRAPAQAFLAYKRRWEIETLFAALKKTGFNMESTQLTQLTRLCTLFTLLALAFTWAHHIGEWLHDTKQKPLRLMK